MIRSFVKNFYFIFLINILNINFIYSDNVNDDNIYIYSSKVKENFYCNKEYILDYIRYSNLSDLNRAILNSFLDEFYKNMIENTNINFSISNEVLNIINDNIIDRHIIFIIKKAKMIIESIKAYNRFLNHGSNCHVCYDSKKIICRHCKVTDQNCKNCKNNAYYDCPYCQKKNSKVFGGMFDWKDRYNN